MFIEILLLMGLLVNTSVYYSKGEAKSAAILFHFASVCLLGGFVVTMDGKEKNHNH